MVGDDDQLLADPLLGKRGRRLDLDLHRGLVNGPTEGDLDRLTGRHVGLVVELADVHGHQR